MASFVAELLEIPKLGSAIPLPKRVDVVHIANDLGRRRGELGRRNRA